MPAAQRCQQARLARDARFDGLFYTAVRTTGIYCRPVCPAPPALARNVAYYPSAAAAAAAGYRPCLRCRPELAPDGDPLAQHPVLRQALQMIGDGMLQQHPASELARRLGISPRQLQRVMLASLGATAVQIHANARLLLARQLLTETSLPVTEVALAAGYRSVRRFNAAFVHGCGMPPTAIRRHAGPTAGSALTLRLAYRPPLDFAAMLDFLRRRALTGIERVDDHSYQRVICTVNGPGLIHVSAHPQRAELLLRLERVQASQIAACVRQVRHLFDLDADLLTVHASLSRDPLLARAIALRPGLRIVGCWDGFETAVRAVLGQQVSVAAATTLAQRLCTRFGTRLADMPGGLDLLFPTPAQLVNAPLQEIGLPARRAHSLQALAAACQAGALHFARGQRLEDFIASATALPGIGDWTAQYIAMRALSLPDAFPAGDLVVQQALGQDQGQRTDLRQTLARAQAWRPWRAYAVIHLWQLAAGMPSKEIRHVPVPRQL